MEKITERTFRFANRIYKLCKKLQELDNYTDKLLASQLFHAGTSIGANTEESTGAQSNKDYINKMEIALKEAKETSYWLRLLINNSELNLDSLLDECEQIKKILAKSIITAKNKKSDN